GLKHTLAFPGELGVPMAFWSGRTVERISMCAGGVHLSLLSPGALRTKGPGQKGRRAWMDLHQGGQPAVVLTILHSMCTGGKGFTSAAGDAGDTGGENQLQGRKQIKAETEA